MQELDFSRAIGLWDLCNNQALAVLLEAQGGPPWWQRYSHKSVLAHANSTTLQANLLKLKMSRTRDSDAAGSGNGPQLRKRSDHKHSVVNFFRLTACKLSEHNKP
eukprot:6176576-Amphidinium_carterae.1